MPQPKKDCPSRNPLEKGDAFPAHTLQAGALTIEFAVGRYSNGGGIVRADVNFTGSNLAGAAVRRNNAMTRKAMACASATTDSTA